MAKKQKQQLNDSAVLAELKETIRQQSEQIKQLQQTQPRGGGGGGHGPPVATSAVAYLQQPFYAVAMQRFGWLAIFLLGLTGTAVIMNGFEHVLALQLELAYFVPLLAGHGGNTGGQSVGTVLTALSSKQVCARDAPAVVAKEALAGCTAGMVLGTLVGQVAFSLLGISAHVSVVVGLTIPVISALAATLGATIPFLCVAAGLDPSVIAAPAMTSLVDVGGLLAYFLIAKRIFAWYGVEL